MMSEAATETASTGAGGSDTTTSEGGKGDGKALPPPIRDALIKTAREAKAKREAAASGKGGGEAPGKPTRGKGEPGKADAKSKADSGKAEPPKAKDDKSKADGEEEKPVEEERIELQRQRRDLAKRTQKIDSREKAVTEAENRLNARAHGETTAFKSDPIGWLKSHGVDVRATVSKWAAEEGEDPKDKALREVKLTADEAKKKAEELAADAEAKRRQEEAQSEIRSAIAEEWSETDTKSLPNLAKLPTASVAKLALDVKLEHARKTARVVDGQVQCEELANDEIFRRLERELARDAKKREGKATDSGESAPPERVRSVAKGKAENPEARSERPRPRDVTNRETRVATTATVGVTRGEDKTSVKDRMRTMVRERLQ